MSLSLALKIRYASNARIIRVLKLLNYIKNLHNNYNLAMVYYNFAKSKSNYNDFAELDCNNPTNPIL